MAENKFRVVQGTLCADTMNQGKGHSTQGQSAPVTSDVVVKLELPWPIKEEPQDQPSAVCSPGQPMSDNTSGSLLSLNTSHACQRCSARFKLSSSLEEHMKTFHGVTAQSESSVSSRLRSSKVELPWPIKEEPQDQPSAVYSPGQPMSDNTSGSLLFLNTSHVCQRCSAAFAGFSSLELHMETCHGDTAQSESPVSSRLPDSVEDEEIQRPSAGAAKRDTGADWARLRPGDHWPVRIPPTKPQQTRTHRGCKVCYARMKEQGATREQLKRQGKKATSIMCKQCKVPLCVEDEEIQRLSTGAARQDTGADCARLRPGDHWPALIPTTKPQQTRKQQRGCKVCYARKKEQGATREQLKRKKGTTIMCKQCQVPLCIVPCFEVFHTVKHYHLA